MNNKITFPRLATMLADQSGRSKRFSESFLREFFALITERLEAGESVKIKGFGTFRLSRVEPRKSVDVTTGQPMEISGHSKVVFVPAKELAEAVNSPFEAFTAIEISDDIDIKQIGAFDSEYANQPEPESEPEAIIEQDAIVTPEPIIEPESAIESDSTIESELTIEPEPESETEPGVESEESIEKESRLTNEESGPSGEEYEEDEVTDEINEIAERPRKINSMRIFLISFGAAMVAIICTLAIWYFFASESFNEVFCRNKSSIKSDNESEYVADMPTEEDTASIAAVIGNDSTEIGEESNAEEVQEEVAPTAPSDVVVYDTIGTTRYLTTMAKAHYGNYNLWPYIYKENEAKLGHPDRIRPGTPVVIPKLSKYGVDPTSKADIDKAKKLGVEIYARYGKSI